MSRRKHTAEIERKIAQAQAVVQLIGNAHSQPEDLDDGYSAILSVASEAVIDLLEEVRAWVQLSNQQTFDAAVEGSS